MPRRPHGASTAARSPRIAPNPQWDFLAQTSEAAQRPPDGQDELSKSQQWHEQFRRAEAARAERMYGGTPMDGVRYDEVEMTSHQEFSLGVPDDLRANLGEGEGEAIVGGFIETGIGRTLANDLVRQGIEASRRGEMSSDRIARQSAETMKALTAKWGDQTGTKLAAAREMISVAEKRWPNIRDFLDRTGLGSDPKLIAQLVARAERRPGRRR